LWPKRAPPNKFFQFLEVNQPIIEPPPLKSNGRTLQPLKPNKCLLKVLKLLILGLQFLKP